jgi:tungstate transport system ATP-binding protein
MTLKLQVSRIFKSYNGQHILEDCSYTFDHLATYVLMGPNGCGKSTFMRICALIEEPDRGEVTYLSGGVSLQKDITLRRRITLVLPRIGVFNTSVFRNVAYGLQVRGLPRDAIRNKVLEALDMVGLGHKKGQNALTLSSGETQRLGIARAMVLEPEILFLDEPTASIDRKNSEIIEGIIQRMKREGRSTVIVMTHDMTQAERLADVLMVMDEGKIKEKLRRVSGAP